MNIVVPDGHPLASGEAPTLAQVAAHPIITFVFGFSAGSSLAGCRTQALVARARGFEAIARSFEDNSPAI